jgi:hypothetical protein
MRTRGTIWLLMGLFLPISGMTQGLWINLGTTINGTKSFDGFFGFTGQKVGGYFMFGIGEGDYELTPAEDYTGIVSIGQANSWGDPIIGYGTKTGLTVFGGGLIVGLDKKKEGEYEDGVNWILFGIEGGTDGPIYQIRRDPYYILGGGLYSIEDPSISPTKVVNARIQYVRDLNNVLLGIGGVVGSHPGVTLNIGYRIGY